MQAAPDSALVEFAEEVKACGGLEAVTNVSTAIDACGGFQQFKSLVGCVGTLSSANGGPQAVASSLQGATQARLTWFLAHCTLV